jgi:hypothetical protein
MFFVFAHYRRFFLRKSCTSYGKSYSWLRCCVTLYARVYSRERKKEPSLPTLPTPKGMSVALQSHTFRCGKCGKCGLKSTISNIYAYARASNSVFCSIHQTGGADGCRFGCGQNMHPTPRMSGSLTELRRPLTELRRPLTELRRPLTELRRPLTELSGPLTEMVWILSASPQSPPSKSKTLSLSRLWKMSVSQNVKTAEVRSSRYDIQKPNKNCYF